MSVYCKGCASLLEENKLLRESHKELVAALEEIERHHAVLNFKAGRDQDGSHTLSVSRAALAKAKEVG